MSINEFRQQLEQHDWFFYYNSQFANVKSGEQNQKRLAQLATESPEHQALFDQYAAKAREAV